MPLYQVISGAGGSKELVEVGAGGGGETWGVHVDALPADPSSLIADLPVGAFVTDNEGGGGGTDLEPRVVALEGDTASLKVRATDLEEGMTAITQTVTAGDTSKTVVAAHQDENGIYGVATDTKYGHVRLLNDPSVETVSLGDTFSARAIKLLVGQMGTPGEINWPNGTVPSIGTMLDDASFLITNSGTFKLPAGKYSVEAVGGGGAGGSGSIQSSANVYCGQGGTGGNSSSPTNGIIALNAPAVCNATIGAGGGATTFSITALDRSIVSSAGAAGSGGGVGGCGASGSSGPSYSHAGGGGGSGLKSSAPIDGVRYKIGSGGGGGGAGSRFSRQITSVKAGHGGAVNLGGASAYRRATGGSGGTGYGAGGGGGGAAADLHSDCDAKGGGSGAPGCILITALA